VATWQLVTNLEEAKQAQWSDAQAPWFALLFHTLQLYAIYGTVLATLTGSWYILRGSFHLILVVIRSVTAYWSRLTRRQRIVWLLAVPVLGAACHTRSAARAKLTKKATVKRRKRRLRQRPASDQM